MISLDNVTFAYPSAAPVFEGFSWQVIQGEAWAIIGASGCGKSTLLALLAGLRPATSGTIAIGGKPLTRPRPYTGLIIQDYGLLPWATVRENAQLGMKVRRFYGPDGTHAPAAPVSTAAVGDWLERLGLAAVAGKYPGQISGGQRQRTAIARTLSLNPDLLLMDEPFSSLDAPTREGLQNLVLELREERGLTLVLVTHAIEEAACMGRKILLLGQPPNRQAEVIENPGAGKAGYRESEDYLAMCRLLRSRLEGG
ncbi:MAG: ATP-binding cassette domain-containing protein [Anaerolineaceae bacterium]|nr:ATP-binding cassette domain-containing protein [Anaerolineaceae bacterium]